MKGDPDDPNWIVTGFLPHEAEVRRWLRRMTRKFDESDIIQEAYYRIWRRGDDVYDAHIESPRSYFFSVVRNIFFEQLRRDQVVQFSELAESNLQKLPSEEVGADRSYAGQQRLAMVQSIIDELPERCRNVIRLRKIEGKSQRETAKLLRVSENVVEKDVARALRYLLRRIGELEGPERLEGQESHSDRRRHRERS
ncbi:RNA polymerase sigma factor [Govanella unica]|uniref:RNA polymerase sigma factor n=1 Tax=Govanella unica TaxID=2975056 RepID=A0A9X3U093_9PROT|nr:RNA polymerase sigma factor [Govania unica]MDA5194996.1 RNA polymerase sigma factor [Govania unica]